jgi:hypothetical protein
MPEQPGKIKCIERARAEIESVGCNWTSYDETIQRYNPSLLKEGVNIMTDGEEVFFVSNPALGLWAEVGRFKQYESLNPTI